MRLRFPRKAMPPGQDGDSEAGPQMVTMEKVPRPSYSGTALLLTGIALTYVFLTGKEPTDVARIAAIGVGASLAGSFYFDYRKGITNVIRPDVAGLLALYFLTLFEFLVPQPDFNSLVGMRGTTRACVACFCGFAGLAIGRHFAGRRSKTFSELFTRPVKNGVLLAVFWACFVLGYLHMFVAVNFNPVELIDAFMRPRFSQPWSRGQYGDWKALLNEFGLLLNLLPPIGGIVISRRRDYGKTNVFLIVGALLFTMFYAFASGTRNIFASYLITFVIGYAFSARVRQRRELIGIGIGAVLLLMTSTIAMLQFRTVGLRAYLEGAEDNRAPTQKRVFVDYNLFVIAHLVMIFPDRHPYLGLEVPYNALIRPIPRAIWKDKPMGLSTSIEDVLGMQGLTLAASFVGEAYLSGGMLVVFAVGLFFGFLMCWWSKLASPRNSQLGILIYASGFFAAVISMRSLFVFTTAILPTLCAAIGTAVIARRVQARRLTLKERTQMRPHKAGRLPK